MRLFVTGAGGRLGTAFLERAAGGHEVHPFSRADLDVGDPHAVMTSVRAVRPHAVLNFAAMTKVDACEGEPAEAGRVNAVGAENVALAASETGAVLLHVSTDYVFDGDKTGLYDELDRPNPISVYGRTKLAGEEAVRRLAPGHFIVRTSYVFGGGRDYVSAAVQRLGRGETVGGIVDRRGTPTFVGHLAERLVPLLSSGRFGTYHLAGPEPASWFDVLTRAEAMGRLPGSVVPQRTEDLRLAAPRPRNSALTSLFLPGAGVPPMPPLDVGIQEALDRQLPRR